VCVVDVTDSGVGWASICISTHCVDRVPLDTVHRPRPWASLDSGYSLLDCLPEGQGKPSHLDFVSHRDEIRRSGALGCCGGVSGSVYSGEVRVSRFFFSRTMGC
jgi:hypothetical protein